MFHRTHFGNGEENVEYRLRIMCHSKNGDRIDKEYLGNKFFIHAASEEEAMDEAESIIKRCVGEYLRKDEEKKVGWVSVMLLSGAAEDSKTHRFLALELKESGFVVQLDIPIPKDRQGEIFSLGAPAVN